MDAQMKLSVAYVVKLFSVVIAEEWISWVFSSMPLEEFRNGSNFSRRNSNLWGCEPSHTLEEFNGHGEDEGKGDVY